MIRVLGRVIAVAAVSSLAFACSQQAVGTCGPGNCEGCCSGGVCREGDADDARGAGAGARARARRAASRVAAHLGRLREQGTPPSPDAAAATALAEAAACLDLAWPPEPDARALARLWSAASREPGGVGALLDHRAVRAAEDPFEGRAERVALLTLHAAKGLEFRAVFIVGCEDGTLPWIRAGASAPEDPHEERRLLYVGMTRAMDSLWLGAARQLRRHGETRVVGPSRLLASIPPRLLRVTAPRIPRKVRQKELDLT